MLVYILTGFAAQFGETPRYDEGTSDAIAVVQTKITEMQTENDELKARVTNLEEKYESAKEEAVLSSTELAKKQEQEAKLDKVKSLFNQSEAKISITGDNLVVHLYGLTFPSGRAIIQPEYFSLLTKVQEAIKLFPENRGRFGIDSFPSVSSGKTGGPSGARSNNRSSL